MQLDIHMDKAMAIAKKEFMDNVRNKWVLALSIIFMLLVVVLSYFGGASSGGDVEFQGFKATVANM
ncbi:MAG: ABC transporter permease subunit, partial [Thermoplasmata archaeon]|nr:ABC transporter permease subunit [Thermoplasmata archaeon]